MKKETKIFKKDLYRKFLFFSIVPILLISLIFIFLIIKEKYDLILSQHVNIIKNIQYNLNIFNQDIKDIPKLLKDVPKNERKALLSDILKYKNSIDTIMILDKNGIIEEISSKTNTKVFSGYDYSNIPVFKEYMKKEKNFLSNIYFSSLVDSPLVSYVFEFNSKIYIIELNLDFLNDLVSNLNSSKISDLSISIIDKNGLYILDTLNKINVLNRDSFFTTRLYKNHIKTSLENTLIKYTNETSDERNYVSFKIINNFNWMIIVKENNNKIAEYIVSISLSIFLIILVIAFVTIASAKKIVNNIVTPLELLTSKINKFAKDHSSKIDDDIKSDYRMFITLIKDFKSMQESIKQQIVVNKQKDKILHEQSKMVAMGEMIGNIAHQWRQPLSVISTAVTGIIMQKKYDILDEEKLIETCNIINDNSQYLSRTIDDFRNFIKGERNKKIFDLEDAVKSFLHLIDASAKNNEINIILDLQKDISINGYENELTQCLINIFNNAKDILIEKKIEEKLIFISTYKNNNTSVIKIKDNAGGIPQEVLPHIFEPYFTSKHKSNGTGLGLHITYNLVVSGMNGTIEACNFSYTHNSKTYTGAEFTITL